MHEEETLNEYKKYDYLEKQIKIFVSYIKPSFLFKTKILIPIHLGRDVAQENSKDGCISSEDLKWLEVNCISDNDFVGNISHENRRIGFLTGTYKAWKNYNKLGGPNYFGSFGYRRLLKPTFFEDLETLDFIVPRQKQFGVSLKEQFISAHGQELYDIMLETLKINHPKDLSLFNEYFQRNHGYFFEIYIMKKELFFDFCDWIFKILFSLLDKHKKRISVYSTVQYRELLKKFIGDNEAENVNRALLQSKNPEVRDIAFIFERLTGFYLYKLTQNLNLKYLEVPVIETEPAPFIKMKDIILSQMRKRAKEL